MNKQGSFDWKNYENISKTFPPCIIFAFVMYSLSMKTGFYFQPVENLLSHIQS